MANRKFEKLPFSRMRSEGFPLIVWGGWTLVRLQLLVGSPSRRRRVVVASLIPSLWGKLQISFSNVSTQLVLPFCVAGVALCDIPTCLLTCRKCQNWRMSRTKLVLVRPRVSSRVSGFPLASPCLWGKLQNRVSSRVSAFPLASPCLWGKLQKLVCFAAPTSPCLWGKLQNLSLCSSSGVAVSMGEAAKPRSFCCAHVAVSMGEAAKPQSLLFLWRRRVYRGSCKTSLVLLRRVSSIFVDFCASFVLQSSAGK